MQARVCAMHWHPKAQGWASKIMHCLVTCGAGAEVDMPAGTMGM